MINYGFSDPNPRTSMRRKMKVTGSGSIKAEPDIATVNLGVVTENMSLEAAQRENTLRTNAVIDSLLKLKVSRKDIGTASFDIQPQYDFVEGRQEFKGFRVTNILSVTVRDLSKTGEIIDTAIASGANRVDSVRFSVENPAEYYSRALSLAVRSASEKAKELSYDFGVQLNPIPIRITEQSSVTLPEEAQTMKLMASSTPILPGQIEITARIEVVFEYR
ncbi:SIMPL domain-containing protein [Clostridium thermarum]|uniref:SIMPL domain-containing protein n=1 Tax=Clostridium thermarum TaxID=1716543 RepID=UPI00111F0FAE|nr:SIMPL domain-containing protein [Clostridium thermarum]